MDKRQLLGLGTFLLGSYTTFHGHRLNKDCRLCQYRGLGWIIAITGIIYNDYREKQLKDQANQSPSYHSYTPRDYSRHETLWENSSDITDNFTEARSQTGSDSSNDTIKESK